MRLITKKSIRFIIPALLAFLVVRPVLVYAQNSEINALASQESRSYPAYCHSLPSLDTAIHHVQKDTPNIPALVPVAVKAKAFLHSNRLFHDDWMCSHECPASFIVLRI
jgi:hypothetical protein